jgi:NAD(P)-dependent dehydrogenase (short-subunit alcohol dehydrogenase family)
MLTMLADSKIKYFYCDVTSPQSIHEAAQAVRDQFGHPSILVNNAGIVSGRSILNQSDQFTEEIFKVNIVSHFALIREYMPDMIKKNKGHIVGLASVASFIAPPGIVDYSATKAAVLALHEGWFTLGSVLFKFLTSPPGLRQEIKHVYHAPGILSTIVHPSSVRTNMVKDFEDQIKKSLGRLIEPEVIGNIIADQIVSCRGGQLIIPKQLSMLTGIRAWTNWLQEFARDLSLGKLAAKFSGSIE